MDMKYICTAPCPELGMDGDTHCKCKDPTALDDWCPCGHEAKWEPIGGEEAE